MPETERLLSRDGHRCSAKTVPILRAALSALELDPMLSIEAVADQYGIATRTLYRYAPEELLARLPDDPCIRRNALLARQGRRWCPGVIYAGIEPKGHEVEDAEMLTRAGRRTQRCKACNRAHTRWVYHSKIKTDPIRYQRQLSASTAYQAGVRIPRMRAATVGKISRADVWERDGGVCGLCGREVDPSDWHMDHVVPIARGGMHTWSNVRVTHPACNRRKGSKLDEEMSVAPVL